MRSITPRILIAPGLNNSGPGHWQTLWEQTRTDCTRVQCASWDAPDAENWVEAVEHSVASAPGKVVFAAHSLGCLAVSLWAATATKAALAKIYGALLVAPPDASGPNAGRKLSQFSAAEAASLPFPTLLIASRNDPYSSFVRSMRMAALWGAKFIDAGDAGHINASSGLGVWRDGQAHLERLLRGPVLTPGISAKRAHAPSIAQPTNNHSFFAYDKSSYGAARV